jgi:pimeloyl-ACP methyl ester carboxylesterase
MLLTAPIVALALLSAPQGEPPKGLEGTWEGFLNPKPAIEYRLVLRVEKKPEGGWLARAECPELTSQAAVKFDQVSFKDNQAVLASKAAAREFVGTLDPAGKELKGDWKVGFVATPLMFRRVEGPVQASDVWEGALTVNGGIKLRLAFYVLKTLGNDYRATMDSIDQGVFGLKVTTVEVSKDSLKLTIKNVGEYEGKIDETGQAVGRWKQGGSNLPLTLKKVAEVSEVRRPQIPKAPFPYASEDVTYESQAKGVRIAGALTIPDGDGPFPVALLITGSGSQDRDESILGHKPFLVLADDLTRRGIAVLRVDDRGVGGSTGNPAESTTLDFVDDVLGGIDFLKGQKRIDPKRIGLIGHSEGGLIAPIVATRTDDVAFIVMLAGPGLPGDQILSSQLVAILRASGADEAKIRSSSELQGRLIAIAKETGDSKQTLDKLKSTRAELLKTLPEDERNAITAVDPSGAQLAALATPWFRYFLSYDPRPTLARVICPILAINGENDLQVPARENLEAIDRAVRSGGNSRITTRELPALNHLFQTSKTGAPSEYGTIEESFAPVALKLIGEWVAATTKKD